MIAHKLPGIFLALLLLLGQSLAPVAVLAETTSATNEALKPEVFKPSVTEESLTAAVAAIEKIAQDQIDENKVPGLSIAIVHDDKLIMAKGFGVRDIGKPDKVDADTAFQLASVSKPFASTVVAALVGQGKIKWDSRIIDLDPDFAMYDAWVTRQLTVRDLFSHRSGLPDHAGDVLEDFGFDRAQVLHQLRYQVPDSSFRSGYAYTNYGITEGAVAAARAYGLSWEDASDKKLYQPLQMTTTSSRYSDFIGRENKALGHVLVDSKWVQKYIRQPDGQSPAGGVSSSATDMQKWMRLQLAGGKYGGKQVVDEAALLETHHPQMVTGYSPLNGMPDFYGLGFNVSYDRSGLKLGHSGGFDMGNATCVKMVPGEHLGIAVLTNAYPVGVAEALATTFTDLAVSGKSSRDWFALFKFVFSNPATIAIIDAGRYPNLTAPGSPALKSDAYTGTYENNYVGKVDIVLSGDDLVMKIGPKKLAFLLKHYNRDTFLYEAHSEYLAGNHGARFNIGPDGKATSFALENLEDIGVGTLMRVAKK